MWMIIQLITIVKTCQNLWIFPHLSDFLMFLQSVDLKF